MTRGGVRRKVSAGEVPWKATIGLKPPTAAGSQPATSTSRPEVPPQSSSQEKVSDSMPAGLAGDSGFHSTTSYDLSLGMAAKTVVSELVIFRLHLEPLAIGTPE